MVGLLSAVRGGFALPDKVNPDRHRADAAKGGFAATGGRRDLIRSLGLRRKSDLRRPAGRDLIRRVASASRGRRSASGQPLTRDREITEGTAFLPSHTRPCGYRTGRAAPFVPGENPDLDVGR